MQRKMTWNAGQSLIEAVVIVGLVVILATGLVAGSTSSLRGSQAVRDKSLAISYTQQGIELSRRLRDASWDEFYSYASSRRCLDSDGNWSLEGSVDCQLPNMGAFTRIVTFDWLGSGMKVTVDVSWQEGSTVRKNTLVTYLTKWK